MSLISRLKIPLFFNVVKISLPLCRLFFKMTVKITPKTYSKNYHGGYKGSTDPRNSIRNNTAPQYKSTNSELEDATFCCGIMTMKLDLSKC